MPNTTCAFEDAVFHRFVNDAIEAHNPTTPLFMFWAPHTIHAPLEVPKPFYDKYKAPAVGDDRRARYLAMVNWLDTAIGETVDLLKRKGMWEDTLVVLTRYEDVWCPTGGAAYVSILSSLLPDTSRKEVQRREEHAQWCAVYTCIVLDCHSLWMRQKIHYHNTHPRYKPI